MTTTTERFRPRLRPLSVGEILDVSIKICIAHWRTLLQTVLIVVVPVQIVSTLLTADYTVSSFDFGATETQTPEETLDELNQYLGGLVLGTRAAGARRCCWRRRRAFARSRSPTSARQADWRSSLGYAVRRAPSLLWLTLLYGLGVLIGFIFLIAPGVWLYIAWAFAMPILLTEGLKGGKALGRSYGLVKGRWWRTFGVIALGLHPRLDRRRRSCRRCSSRGIFFDSDNDTLVLVLSAIAGIVGLLITTPLQAALLAVVYFDLRVRKEGFDLELLAQGIGGTAPQEPDELVAAAAAGVDARRAVAVARGPAAAAAVGRAAARRPSRPPGPRRRPRDRAAIRRRRSRRPIPIRSRPAPPEPDVRSGDR